MAPGLYGIKHSQPVSPREFVRKVDTSKFVHEASHLPEGAWLQDYMGSNTLNQFPQRSLGTLISYFCIRLSLSFREMHVYILPTFQEELGSGFYGVKNFQTVSPREFVRKMNASKFVRETSLPGGALFQDSMGQKLSNSFPKGVCKEGGSVKNCS